MWMDDTMTGHRVDAHSSCPRCSFGTVVKQVPVLLQAAKLHVLLHAAKCLCYCKLPSCTCLVNGLACTNMCKLQTCSNQEKEQFAVELGDPDDGYGDGD